MRTRKNAELRKPEILGFFYETIIEEGIEGASIGKVAKKMGIHPSLIMHYFSTKENMMIEMVDYIIREYASLLNNIPVGKDDPEARLHQLFNVLWGEQWYGMTSIAADFSIISVSFRSPEISERLQHLYSLFRKHLCRELEIFTKAGIIRVEDPLITADIIITMLEGYRHFKHFYVDELSSGKFREEMKKAALSMLNYEPGSPSA